MAGRRIPVSRLGATSAEQPSEVTARRECSERVMALPRGDALPLGLEAGTLMVARSIKLIVEREPVLIATSYLPAELALTDEPSQWQNVDIEDLAVVGYGFTPAEFIDSSARWPTATERQVLGIHSGARIPLTILSQSYQVQADDHTLPAGLLVLVRNDKAHLHCGREYQGLVLRR